MEKQFWEEKWRAQELGFHLPFVHPILKRNLAAFNLPAGATVFLPLCGKTLDIGWLLDQGLRVVGVELSELAVSQLFESLGVRPDVSPWGDGRMWRHGALTVFQGDFFALTTDDPGDVAMVYDRAALVALPAAMRERYAAHLATVTARAPQLLITFEYDQNRMDGPPFSVPAEDVERLYGSSHVLECLSRKDVIDNQPAFRERGLDRFEEIAWWLTPL